MPTPAKLARVRISSTETGTYAILGKTRSYELNEGSEGGETIRWFGGEAAFAGDPTVGGTIPFWFDREDTTGQEMARTAKRTGATVWLQFCPEGTATGAKCEQLSAVIEEINQNADSTARAVEGSLTYRGNAATLTTVTLA